MQSRLLLALALVLFPVMSHAASFTGADLPGAGQTLTITEDSQFLIGAGETATWGGAISAGGGFKVDFLNQGSIQGSGHLQNSSSATFNFRNEGILEGNVNILNDAMFRFSNAGTSSGTFNVTNNVGGFVEIQNNKDFNSILNFNTNGVASNTNGVAISNLLNTGNLSKNILFQSHGSATVNFLNNGILGGAVSIQNHAADFNFQSNGDVSGAFNVTNTGGGTFNFQNNHDLNATLNLNTYGANTNLANSGQFSGTLNVLDQFDQTKIFNSGTISDAALNFTANGHLGIIGLQNNGLITDTTSTNNANYGGQIAWNNLFGSADFDVLSMAANGSSHGVNSSILMIYNRNVTAGELNVYGPQDASFLTASLDRKFAGFGGASVVFDGVNGTPESVPEPATMLLLGSGLIGLVGIRRGFRK